MSSTIDWSKAEKFPSELSYFNISVLWIFYYRRVVRLFYYLRLHPQTVLALSFLCGLLSVVCIWRNYFIAAAIFLHFKDIFDASDGSLARLTGRTSRIGRFLDSLEDFLVLTLVIAVITAKAWIADHQFVYLILGFITWLSLFLQCSYFNYYQLKYAESIGMKNLVANTDERIKSNGQKSSPDLKTNTRLLILQHLYAVVYGWQDRLMQGIDHLSLAILSVYPNLNRNEWYQSKLFLTLNSPLCFGTHIFVFIICLILGNAPLALWIISIMFNLYFSGLMAGRIIYFKARLIETAG